MDRGSREAFTQMGTLGIEEEFYVVDADARPTSGTDTLVYESDPPPILEDHIDHELFKCVIETQTPLIEDVGDAEETMRAVRSALCEHASEHGFAIAGAGLHPAADWTTLEHVEKPRYRSQLERIQYPQHRNTTAGLHVHVGVDDADKAIWVANECRWHVSLLLALSANSPYWCGSDTGLQSARAKIFEALPNTGIPSAFANYDEFDAFERTMLESEAIDDRGELWFDVRPHSELGTVEVRTPDGQRDPDVVMAFVEYVHALVVDLAERYEDGESASERRRELLDENKWRAIRHGQDADLLGRDLTEPQSLESLVVAEADRLDTPRIADILDADSGAERQRRRRQNGGLDELCESLVLQPT